MAETDITPSKKEAVDHPPHYNQSPARCLGCGRPIECIDVIEHMRCNIANAVKYLWRADHKHSSPVEDLKKAKWYVSREIERVEREEHRSKDSKVQCQDIVDHVRADLKAQKG